MVCLEPGDRGGGSVSKRWICVISFALLTCAAAGGWPARSLAAEPFYQGPEKCTKCHVDEAAVWEGTRHFKSFRSLHRKKKAKKITKATGAKRIKGSKICTKCHYTMAQKKAGSRAKALTGPSCESCHGPSSEYIEEHAIKKVPKAERLKTTTKEGMIWSHMLYEIADNCNGCHAMENPTLDGKTIEKMLDAGHPINPYFELVRYSQGTVRHRFYAPHEKKNAQMTDQELARLYVVGQAAALVSTASALKKTKHKKFVKAQTTRAKRAKKVLNALKSKVPEAGKLLAEPTDANGRALAVAVRKMDLTAIVGKMLPKKKKYK